VRLIETQREDNSSVVRSNASKTLLTLINEKIIEALFVHSNRNSIGARGTDGFFKRIFQALLFIKNFGLRRCDR